VAGLFFGAKRRDPDKKTSRLTAAGHASCGSATNNASAMLNTMNLDINHPINSAPARRHIEGRISGAL
jgi:hypothetical protein